MNNETLQNPSLLIPIKFSEAILTKSRLRKLQKMIAINDPTIYNSLLGPDYTVREWLDAICSYMVRRLEK